LPGSTIDHVGDFLRLGHEAAWLALTSSTAAPMRRAILCNIRTSKALSSVAITAQLAAAGFLTVWDQ